MDDWSQPWLLPQVLDGHPCLGCSWALLLLDSLPRSWGRGGSGRQGLWVMSSWPPAQLRS